MPNRINVEGSGAGLSIVQSIIKEHKGNIWIDWSEPGEGTAVTFTIRKKLSS